MLKCQEFYKIGKTRHMSERLSNLQIAIPFDLEMVMWLPRISHSSAHKLEHKLHKLFSEKHFRGEWFKLAATDLEIVKQYDDFTPKGEVADPNEEVYFQILKKKRRWMKL